MDSQSDFRRRLELALEEWRTVLGEQWVATAEQCARYHPCTTGLRRQIAGAIQPSSEAEVIAAVKTASRFNVPLYPISTGRNWGYGTANPAVDDCVIVDLSRMNKVLSLDVDLGLATIQPGVTQKILWDAVGEHNFLVPVTGAGPTAGIVGNALERGYGITPYGDHFGAVNSLTAVLADGSIYRSALSEAGGTDIDRAFKWGVGPYVDGLFSQGNLGIVTEMTIALARRPERVELLLFELAADSCLEPFVTELRRFLQSSSVTIAFNLMNRKRVSSMMGQSPQDLPPWLGICGLYGTSRVVSALRRDIRAHLRKYCRRIIRFHPWNQRFYRTALNCAESSRIVPRRWLAPQRERFDRISGAFELFCGRPNETALKLAYWRRDRGRRPAPGAATSASDLPLDPARDGCGLIWYAPLVPLTGTAVRRYVEMVNDICPKHGFEPMITLTTLSPHCFDSTVPILFDKDTEIDAAEACYDDLYKEGQRLGFLPYRMSPQNLGRYTQMQGSVFWNIVGKINQAVDPQAILSPGRYSPVVRSGTRMAS